MSIVRTLLMQHPRLRQFVKFCLVGGTAAAINFLVYLTATDVIGWWYVYSAVAAFLISAVFNFSFNKFWTFRNTEVGVVVWRQISKFGIVMGSGLIINTSLIFALTEWFGVHYRWSWFFATGAVTAWSFTFNKFWTFRKKKGPELSSDGL